MNGFPRLSLGGLPELLIQTLDGLIKVRPRILQVDTANMTLVENPPGTLTLGATAVGGSLEVKEADGAPDVSGVSQIIVSNGTLTDNGSGSVTITTGGGGGNVATDTIWDAKGDLAAGTGADTASKLGVGTDGQVLSADSTQATGLKWETVSGTGTVTSVAATVPTGFSVAGSPVTTTGTLAVTLDNQSGNKVLSSPSNGTSGTPAFRALVAADIPAIAESGVTSLVTDLGNKSSTTHTTPVMVASGGSHAAGHVPDPGASGGTTKYLREDASWAVPPGGSAITIAELDGAPSGTPGTLKFPNTTLTDNGDGSYTYTAASDSSKAPIASPTFTGTTTAPEFSASGLTGATAASRYVGATTSGAPVSGTFSTGDWIAAQDGIRWTCTTGGSPGTWAQEPGTGGVGGLTATSSALSGDVTCTTANTYYDGPSITLAAGDWLITATLTLLNSTGGGSLVTAKLWDGSTVYASTETFAAASSQDYSLSLSNSIHLSGSTTVKVSAAWNNNGGTIAHLTANNGTVANATRISALGG